MVVTKQLNLFPAKGGVSEYYSPHMIMTQRDIDYNKHCVASFGSFVQANQNNEFTNTQAPRTIDAIYLRPMNNVQGGHEVLNLATGNVVTRNRVWERPITDLVIQAVEDMATKQNIKSMKLTGRNKSNILPTDWIVGVEYDPQDETEDEDDENYEYEDDDEEDLEDYDKIDQNEIDDVLAGENKKANNYEEEIDDVQDEDNDNEQNQDDNEEGEEQIKVRPRRERREPD